ncbi:hemicentin-2-like [Acipenser ruthenus]|uniref:hemicentin-2-like n=1 Tax=Acipenser ruthenus TaxID=7906 RepID=UPI002740681C|nr:hemicentin-2-like [Acipenser ruthenus]
MEVLLIFTILLLAPQSPVVCADDRIAVSPADATVQIGGSITLICSTTCPNGKPEWKKGLDALPYKPRTSGELSEIEIQDAQTEHEGTYMCMVMCEQKTIRKILALTVFSLPDLTVQCDPKEPVSGQPFSLSCSLHGVYPPGSVKMRWLHGERVIEGPAGAEESADDTFYNYELRTKQQLHATTAEYRCEADLVLPNKLIKTKNQTLPLHFQVVPSMSTSFLRKPLGEPASFTCKADPSFSISWAKLGSQGAWGPPGHWNLSVSAGFSLVHIEALQPGDSGNYSCILNNEATKVELSITIEVSYAPKNTSLTPSEPSVKEGDPLTLTCRGDASPEPQIRWTKLNSTLPDSWSLSTGQGQSTLTAPSLAPEHSGIYQCEISNGVGREALTTTLDVLYAPKNTSLTPSEPSVKEGDPLTLTCRGDASPEPQIRWTKLNSTLPDSWSLSTGQGQSTLTAPSLAPEHSGIYQCEISNSIGREALTTTLDVLYAPKNTSLTPSEPSVKEGDPLTLTCRGDASPEPQIRWTKLNSTLPDSWSLSTGQGQSTLTAPSLAPEHSGTYQCEISNVVGREALTTTLDVLYSPRNIGADSGVITGNKGQSLKINCSWDANPKPDIQWLKLGSEKQDHWEISESGKNSQLRINALGSDDLGVYTCLIRNKMGEIHSNTTVRATGEHGVQTMTITIATALPALVLSLFGALVGRLRKNRQSSLSINP